MNDSHAARLITWPTAPGLINITVRLQMG